MSAYEQRIEPPDRSWQYLLFAAEPYETISFKVCSGKKQCRMSIERLRAGLLLIIIGYLYVY